MPLRYGRSTRVVQIIRLLRAAGPLPRRRRMPRQQQPDTIRLSYYRAIEPFVEVAKREMDRVLPDLQLLLRRKWKADSQEDTQAQALVELARKRALERFDPQAITEVARSFGKRTSDFQKEQLDREIRAAFAVPLSAIEGPILAQIDQFAAENVDLIKTVPQRYFDRVKEDVEVAFAEGATPGDLADDLQRRYGMAEDDALRIARDQIGKLNAEVNQARQEAMGVEGYIWRGMLDNRERDEHMEREGERFTWNDPPEDGHPGEAIMCRCYAEPDFGPILESLDD